MVRRWVRAEGHLHIRRQVGGGGRGAQKALETSPFVGQTATEESGLSPPSHGAAGAASRPDQAALISAARSQSLNREVGRLQLFLSRACCG